MKLIFGFLMIVIQSSVILSANAADKWVSVESATRELRITGFTRARSKMPLISEVSGKVRDIFADIGEAVPSTKQFACLDDTFVDMDIKSANSEVRRHYVDIKFFKKQVARHKQLVKKHTSSVSLLDGLLRDLGKANQDWSIASIRKQRLEELKHRHCIEAPIDWLVIDRDIEIGQWINAGEVVAHVGNYSQLIIPLRLSRQELVALKQEKENIEAYFPDLKIKAAASIEHISPGFDEKTRKILVDLLISKVSSKIAGGMRAELILKIDDAKRSSFIISKVALEERFEEYWVERKDGKRMSVKLLNDQPGGKVTISSTKISTDDQFKVLSP